MNKKFKSIEELFLGFDDDGAKLASSIELTANHLLVETQERVGRSNEDPTAALRLSRSDGEGWRVRFDAVKHWKWWRRLVREPATSDQ